MVAGPRRPRGAFTLIELLIVVAIIAILAAIAVPNFLEAQTRSKVSRSKTDMRTFATAMEAYCVDNGKYTLDQNEAATLLGLGGTERSQVSYAWSRLTTPVAYMTTPLFDVFGGIAGDPNDPVRDLYRFFVLRAPPLAGVGYEAYAAQANAAGFSWYVRSIGPSLLYNAPSLGANAHLSPMVCAPGYPIYIYDSTNGTKSAGYIWRTSKGDLDAGQLKQTP
ncbi:MAG TPA: prepilin-type N-terminal cleavage/methylation domain-containing protein [Sumerlaeia bacterium]|nr:prepilin-type N-terminal cleavage/methylation domain-containing protein [Sumerlaeia bacterium]